MLPKVRWNCKNDFDLELYVGNCIVNLIRKYFFRVDLLRKSFLFFFFICSFTSLPADHQFSGLKSERHIDLLKHHEEGWQSPSSTLAERHYLFGSWCGWRKEMAEKGITVTSSYTANPLANVSGGERQGFAYTGSYGIDAKCDLEKIFGCRDWEFYVAFGWRAGSNLARKIGNQFPPAQVYGNQTWWLNQFYFRKTFCQEKGELKFGRIEGGDNFLQNPLYYHYVSNAFDGNPIGIFFNANFSAYPNSQWGAYLRYDFLKVFRAKFAIYSTNPRTNYDNGFNWRFRGDDGTLYITEWSYRPNQEPCSQGLPGNYKVAYYHYSGKFDRFRGGTARGNYGGYLLVDQMIYRRGGPGSDCGLTPWVAFLFAPKDRNTFPFFFDGGVVYKGWMRCRPHDVSAFGLAYGSYSETLRDVQQIAKMLNIPGVYGDRPQNFEMVIELNHLFQINKYSYVQPCLQYIIDPKGYGDIPNALVLGGQFGIIF